MVGEVVARASFRLAPAEPASVKATLADMRDRRRAAQPSGIKTFGSTFKNPGGNKTAGMLIDEVGLKGFRMGGAQVSTQHCNYFINTGNATSADVLKLIDHVRKTVAKKAGVELELEIKVVGV